MQRVTGLPEEQVLAYEAQAELAMRAALQSVADQIAKRIEAAMPVLASVLVAADPEPPPPGQPYVSPDDLASIPPLWQQAVEQQIIPVVAQVFMDAVGRTHASMVEASSIANLPSVGSLAAEQYLAQAQNTFEQVGDDLWAHARTALQDGFEQGESIPDLAERVRQSANVTARTAVLVARTQVNEASNAGSFAVAQASGLQMQKEWIATPDLRTRPTHLAADGQRVALTDPFIVGGFSAMFPAAPSLPPSERYNCRCTIGYVMPDRAPAQVKADDLQTHELADLSGTTPTTLAKAAEPGSEIDLPAYGHNPPSYVRPSLRDAKTPRQLRKAWQDEVQGITGYPFFVDAMPRGISMVTAREYAEGTLQMFAQFPAARIDRIHWFDDASGPYAHVRSGAHAIEFNMRYATETARPKLLASRRKDVAGWDGPQGLGWSVRGDVPAQGIVYHEFVHIVDEENLRRAIHGDIVPLLIRHAQREGVTDIDDLIKRRISSYATENYHEMIAEAATDVMVNGAAASQLSRDIFDLLRAEYRRRGFAVRTAPIDELAAEAERFGKAAAPRVLSTQTVAHLRALAKERGIAIPAGARKADLIKALEEPSKVTPPLDEKAALRAAARERNRLIESSQGTARLLAELDELIANKATKAAIRQRLDPALIAPEQVYAGADLTIVEALRAALDTGDPAKLRSALTRAGTKTKLKPIGKAGAKAKFDPETMEGVGGIDIAADAQVTVVRRGTTLTLPDGSTLQLTRAQVTPIAPKPAPIKAATRRATAVKSELPSRAPAEIQARQAQLREIAARPVIKDEQVYGGESAFVRKLEHEGGPPTITKDTTRIGKGAAAKRDADAEELGSLTAEAVGIRAPTVIRIGPSKIEMEFIEGKAGGGPAFAAPRGGWEETDDGRLMGLLDYLTGNPDRSDRNWLLLPDGRMASLDMGDAFRAQKMIGTRDSFGSSLMLDDETGKLRKIIEINPADLAVIRARLEALAPEFDRLGRGTWHRQVMARLAEVEKRADLAAPVRLPGATPSRMTSAQFQAKIKSAAKGEKALDAAPTSIADREVRHGPQYKADALDRYRISPDVNAALRPGDVEAISRAEIADIHEIDAAFDASRLTHDIESWRGLHSGRSVFGDPKTWGDDLAGFEWMDPAYSSTTTSDMVAHRFIGADGGVRLRLLIPTGSKVIQVSRMPRPGPGLDWQNEAELLLARGTRFRVIRDRGYVEVLDERGRRLRIRDLDVEVIVPDETPPLP